MKAIYRIIIAIFAVAASAVSCSKDAVPEGGTQTADGSPRVITLSYGASVKSTLDGFTPTFSNGDRIMLSNGTSTEECTVSVDGGKATVTTNLPGVLKAVSPASAAVKTGGDLTYKVPATQSGTFTEAAIATAQNIISSAEFEIQVSILKFYVDKSIKVKSIKVESSQNIATAGSSNLKQITVGSGASYLHNVADDPQQRLCYAAVLPGVPASGLKFTSDTDTQGTVTRQSPASTVTLAKNTLYKAFIPYYIKMGTQKWGYCNVGAFLPEEAGKYFAWGDTEGQYAATAGANAFTTKPFNWANAPFNNGSSTFNQAYFDAQKSTVCPGGILALEYDAAYKNWGANWRMPTGMRSDGADIVILAKACGKNPDANFVISLSTTSSIPTVKGVYRYNGTGVKGIYFVDENKNMLFFPASGRGSGTSIDTTEYPPVTYGFYWSCTLNSTEGNADRMDFNAGNLSLSLDNQFNYGYCVRPIYKTPAGPLDIGGYDAPTDIE